MEKDLDLKDRRKIYFARKAVHLYKHFKAKYARATDLLNKNMGCDDTFPPMLRCTSAVNWRNWKRVVVLLDRWIKKDGFKKFESKILLNTCIVVLKMMVDHEQKVNKLEILRLDRAQKC